MKIYIISFLIGELLLFSCGNTKDKESNNSGFKSTYKTEEISCMGSACKKNEDCTCPGADVCIPEEAAMDTAIGENKFICTIADCDISSLTSCPQGWVCHELIMGGYLMKNARTICILQNDAETADDAVAVEDADTALEIDEQNDADTIIEFPACYGTKCTTSTECCDGTSCLPKESAQFSDKITVTEICVVKGCSVSDPATCPEEYTCVAAMGSLTFCVK